ncbi:MAG: hypothetical protein WDN04_16585 [Rhodospirillales bacterium]
MHGDRSLDDGVLRLLDGAYAAVADESQPGRVVDQLQIKGRVVDRHPAQHQAICFKNFQNYSDIGIDVRPARRCLSRNLPVIFASMERQAKQVVKIRIEMRVAGDAIVDTRGLRE